MLLLPFIVISLVWYRVISSLYCLYLIFLKKHTSDDSTETIAVTSIFTLSWLSEYVFMSYFIRMAVWGIVLVPGYRETIYQTLRKFGERYQDQMALRVERIVEDLQGDVGHLRQIWNPNTPATILSTVSHYCEAMYLRFQKPKQT